MSALPDLSPDQRAVLDLLLKQGRTYGELAALLRIDESAVRGRAATALDTLAGPAGAALDDRDVDRLTDHVLGQGDAGGPVGAGEQAWVDAVGAALREGGLEPRGGPPGTPPAEPTTARPAADPPAPTAAPPATPSPPTSRLGGVLIILGVLAVVAVIGVLVLGGGSDDEDPTASIPASTAAVDSTGTTTTPAATTTTPLQVEAQINMTPPGGGGKALGVATIVTDGTSKAVQIQTQGLEANGKSDLYALWLTGGTDGKAAVLLGFQKTPVDKTGRFEGTAALPADSAAYRRIELSRETRDDPTKPTDVVLRGTLK